MAIAGDIEEIEREEAKQRESTRKDTGYVKLTNAEKGESKEKAAKAVGMSMNTYKKAQDSEKSHSRRDPEP